jgi:hypothetical protein
MLYSLNNLRGKVKILTGGKRCEPNTQTYLMVWCSAYCGSPRPSTPIAISLKLTRNWRGGGSGEIPEPMAPQKVVRRCIMLHRAFQSKGTPVRNARTYKHPAISDWSVRRYCGDGLAYATA